VIEICHHRYRKDIVLRAFWWHAAPKVRTFRRKELIAVPSSSRPPHSRNAQSWRYATDYEHIKCLRDHSLHFSSHSQRQMPFYLFWQIVPFHHFYLSFFSILYLLSDRWTFASWETTQDIVATTYGIFRKL